MSATLPILNAFKQRLNEQCPDWDIQLMPDIPSDFYLAHPVGAVLISYAGSKFQPPRSTSAITQTRTLNIVLTVVSRNLHNDEGAIEMLDRLRLAVVGFSAPSCDPAWLLEEQFDEQESGVWIYQLVVATQTVQVEQRQVADNAEPKSPFKQLIPRYHQAPLDERLKPKFS